MTALLEILTVEANVDKGQMDVGQTAGDIRFFGYVEGLLEIVDGSFDLTQEEMRRAELHQGIGLHKRMVDFSGNLERLLRV